MGGREFENLAIDLGGIQDDFLSFAESRSNLDKVTRSLANLHFSPFETIFTRNVTVVVALFHDDRLARNDERLTSLAGLDLDLGRHSG